MPTNVPVNKGSKIEMDDGAYHIVCLKVKQDKLENAQFGTGDVLRLVLQFPDVMDEENEKFAELDAIANFTISPKSKLFGWATAFGCKPDLEVDEWDAECMEGKEAQAIIENQRKDDGSVWPRVKDIVPLPKGRGQPAAASVRPVIKSDGTVNFAAFWQECARLGGTREGMAMRLETDMEGLSKKLASMDPADVAGLLEDLVI